MYEGKSSKLFAQYAVPQMIGLLCNSVYMIVDGVFIGNRLGREAMAAAGIGVPVLEILIALSMAIASGAGVMISNVFGKNDRQSALRVFTLGVWLCAGVGALIAVLGNVLIHPLVNLLGATAQIHADAVCYLRYIVTFSPFLLFSFFLSGMARNDGKPGLAMFALTAGSASNIVLDYVFMYPLNMGIGGAALATAIGPALSVMILLPHFVMKKGRLHLDKTKPDYRLTGRICVLGFPAFIMECTIGLITLVYNLAIRSNGFGEMGLAAYLLIGYLMLIVLTLFLGMAEGLQPVFSHFAGTGEHAREKALRSYAVKVFLLVGVASYLLILLLAKPFYGIFSPQDAELVAFAQGRSAAYFSGFFLAGYNILMISYWQSMQQAGRALGVSLLRSIALPVLLLMLLPLLCGAESIWACHSLSEALTACTAAVWYLKTRGK